MTRISALRCFIETEYCDPYCVLRCSEFFNLLNHSNFLAAASRRDLSSFGTITGTFPARQIQFALKLYY